MSILGNIMSAILGDKAQSQDTPAAAHPHASAEAEPAPPPTPTPPRAGASPAAAPTPAPAPTPTATQAPIGVVDVAMVLDERAEETDEDLDWRRSIVDLMKILKLDSSLAARKTLAKELNYTGDGNDSAAMNVWLHKQVMAKLAQNGGKLPADLSHKA